MYFSPPLSACCRTTTCVPLGTLAAMSEVQLPEMIPSTAGASSAASPQRVAQVSQSGTPSAMTRSFRRTAAALGSPSPQGSPARSRRASGSAITVPAIAQPTGESPFATPFGAVAARACREARRPRESNIGTTSRWSPAFHGWPAPQAHLGSCASSASARARLRSSTWATSMPRARHAARRFGSSPSGRQPAQTAATSAAGGRDGGGASRRGGGGDAGAVGFDPRDALQLDHCVQRGDVAGVDEEVDRGAAMAVVALALPDAEAVALAQTGAAHVAVSAAWSTRCGCARYRDEPAVQRSPGRAARVHRSGVSPPRSGRRGSSRRPPSRIAVVVSRASRR